MWNTWNKTPDIFCIVEPVRVFFLFLFTEIVLGDSRVPPGPGGEGVLHVLDRPLLSSLSFFFSVSSCFIPVWQLYRKREKEKKNQYFHFLSKIANFDYGKDIFFSFIENVKKKNIHFPFFLFFHKSQISFMVKILIRILLTILILVLTLILNLTLGFVLVLR